MVRKIIFLEGLPGVGKTTLIKKIESLNYKNIDVVHEIINKTILDNKPTTQLDFMINDDLKLSKYNSNCIIDRGPISTLSYNEAKQQIDKDYKFDNSKTNQWFENYKSLLSSDDTYVYFLTTNKKSYHLPYNNTKDPYGSIKNQKLLETITLTNCKKYVKNLIIKEYHKKNLEELAYEIVDKFMCPWWHN